MTTSPRVARCFRVASSAGPACGRRRRRGERRFPPGPTRQASSGLPLAALGSTSPGLARPQPASVGSFARDQRMPCGGCWTDFDSGQGLGVQLGLAPPRSLRAGTALKGRSAPERRAFPGTLAAAPGRSRRRSRRDREAAACRDPALPG